jgi:HipA-like protein
MLKKIKNWFSKSDIEHEVSHVLPQHVEEKFMLKVNDLNVGVLYCENGEWLFKYHEEYKKSSNEYYNIVGFPDLNKVYKSDHLWPFFQIRIPGLKQPAIQEIIKKENINIDNEAALLRRFGNKSIANPYELEPTF